MCDKRNSVEKNSLHSHQCERNHSCINREIKVNESFAPMWKIHEACSAIHVHVTCTEERFECAGVRTASVCRTMLHLCHAPIVRWNSRELRSYQKYTVHTQAFRKTWKRGGDRERDFIPPGYSYPSPPSCQGGSRRNAPNVQENYKALKAAAGRDVEMYRHKDVAWLSWQWVNALNVKPLTDFAAFLSEPRPGRLVRRSRLPVYGVPPRALLHLIVFLCIPYLCATAVGAERGRSHGQVPARPTQALVHLFLRAAGVARIRSTVYSISLAPRILYSE